MAYTRQPVLSSGGRPPVGAAPLDLCVEDDQTLYGNAYLADHLDEEEQVCRAPEPAEQVCVQGDGSEWMSVEPLQSVEPEQSIEPEQGVEAEPGVAGPRAPQSYVPPADASDEELFAHYSEIARQNGHLFPIGPDGQPMPTVIGLRGVDINGRVHDTENRRRADPAHGQEGGYDDTLIILHPDGRVERMAYSSHPFQNRSGASPNADGSRDGSGDVGIIRPGEYYAAAGGNHAGDTAWHVRNQSTSVDENGNVRMTPGDDHLPAWRDTDHDFRISDAERTASEGRTTNNAGRQTNREVGDYANGVLFHQIRPGVATDSSIACQVQPHDDFQDFEAAVGPRQSFNYVLVDVNGDPRQRAQP